MGSESFTRALDELGERVGSGTLRGAVEVDQVYAQFQHEGLDLRHPRGGQAKYLEQPLYDRFRAYLQRIADIVLRGDVVDAMTTNVEDLSGQVQTHAPVEFTDLRNSGHPTVTQGTVRYDRPPAQPRLTDEQLRAKNQLRSTGDGGFGDGMGSLYGY